MCLRADYSCNFFTAFVNAASAGEQNMAVICLSVDTSTVVALVQTWSCKHDDFQLWAGMQCVSCTTILCLHSPSMA
jgi:hypothetical protein